ncbi:MAG TPA: hypothetical protein VFJ58_19750 [Armatimonadota bacterium]|nr:hypothetical protein [Armatimonadota bacterium]
MAPWKKGVISAFIIFHVVAVASWLMPDSTIKQNLTTVTFWYVIPVGLWQAWDMFAPNPSGLNMYVHARVQNSDGSVWEYSLPRMNRLGFVARYAQERFRKYVENAHLDASRRFWPDMARWVARQDREQTGKIPTHVQLIRTWWEVPAPPPDTSQAPPEDWRTFTFYNTDIKNGAAL